MNAQVDQTEQPTKSNPLPRCLILLQCGASEVTVPRPGLVSQDISRWLESLMTNSADSKLVVRFADPLLFGDETSDQTRYCLVLCQETTATTPRDTIQELTDDMIPFTLVLRAGGFTLTAYPH